jgi:hypothetical protein
MTTRRSASVAVLSLVFLLCLATSGRLVGAPAELRPIELADILAWKGINVAEISPDGRWFAARVSPLEGDSEVVIRETRGAKEYRIPVGELGDAPGGGAPGGPGGPGASQAVQFSKD